MKKLFALMACSMIFACVACDDSDSSKKVCTKKADCAQNEVCITSNGELLVEAGKTTETPKAETKKEGTCKKVIDDGKECKTDADCSANATKKTCVKKKPEDEKGACGLKLVDEEKECKSNDDCAGNATKKTCVKEANAESGKCNVPEQK